MSVPVGVLLNAEYPGSELMRLGELAEALGYRWLWYTDVRMLRECYVGLASVAMRTGRILLATGVTDPYSRHPAITAAAIATLDELSNGRAVLGLGLGGSGFRELGIRKVLPVAALREGIAAVRALLRGEDVTVTGKVVSLSSGRLQFAPYRPMVPIYIATQGAQISRLAGEIADGVLVANTASRPGIEAYLDRIGQGAERSGRSLSDIDIHLRWEICLSENEKAARDVMRKRLARRLINAYPEWDFLQTLGVAIPDCFAQLAAKKHEAPINEAAALLPSEVLDASVLAGSPGRVAARIRELMRPEITGITIRPHACLDGTVADVMRSFMQDVVPQLSDKRRLTRLANNQ